MKTLAPSTRVDALTHLGGLVELAAALAPAPHAAAVVRQVRCDLHALGVTSDELDAAGIR